MTFTGSLEREKILSGLELPRHYTRQLVPTGEAPRIESHGETLEIPSREMCKVLCLSQALAEKCNEMQEF